MRKGASEGGERERDANKGGRKQERGGSRAQERVERGEIVSASACEESGKSLDFSSRIGEK